jgi:hypothetical protein
MVVARPHRRWVVATALVAAMVLLGACGDDASPLVGSPATTTTVGSTTTTAAPDEQFSASVEAVTADELGASWHAGCPVAVADLRTVRVAHWGMDGTVHQGRLVVAAAEADPVAAVFRALFDARSPIARMEPIAACGGDDDASMAANNTSGFNCRTVKGSGRLSEHAYGRAIDVNPLRTPYVYADGRVDPPSGAAYADRARTDPGVIHDGDPVVAAFADQGWGWGGHWSGGHDYQHFSASGR